MTEAPRVSLSYRLTMRQQDVLLLLCQGMSNKEIADNLGITAMRVARHMTRLFAKFECRNRYALIGKIMKDNQRLNY